MDHATLDLAYRMLRPPPPIEVCDALVLHCRETQGGQNREDLLRWPRVAQHEAAHAVCVEACRWKVNALYLTDDGGYTQHQPFPRNPRPVTLRRAIVVSLAGYAWEAISGYTQEPEWLESSDVRQAWWFAKWNWQADSAALVMAGWTEAVTLLSVRREAVERIAGELIDGAYSEDRPMTGRLLRRMLKESMAL